MRNNRFPHWLSANEVLTELVDKHFGAYVYGDGPSIDLVFLPKAKFDVVPEIERVKFVMVYNSFAEDIGKELQVEEIFSLFSHTPNTPVTRDFFKHKVEQAIERYNYENPHNDLKTRMKVEFGIPFPLLTSK